MKSFGEDVDTVDLEGKVQNESIINIKSLIWPGAYTTFYRKKHFFIYLGNGLKFSMKKYHPQFFFEIQNELNEQPIQ